MNKTLFKILLLIIFCYKYSNASDIFDGISLDIGADNKIKSYRFSIQKNCDFCGV